MGMTHFVDRGKTTFESEKQDEEAQAELERKRAQEVNDRKLALEMSQRVSDVDERDAAVRNQFEVKLPLGARAGDRQFFRMPQGCTDPDSIEFIVPRGAYGGDVVKLTAEFRIFGTVIKTLRDI